jgi:hypothetical protein
METPILAVLRRCSRQLLCLTLFAQYFWVFSYGEQYLAAILSLLPFSCINVEFMLKSGVFGE